MLGQLIVSVILSSTVAPSNASLVKVAASACANAKKPVDMSLLRAMMELEDEHGVPAFARGITLAAACRESGFKANPRRGDGGKAVGILQMWPWWSHHYGIKRTDPLQAVGAWLYHIGRVTKKAHRRCEKSRRAWLVAQAWVSSGPKGWTCRYSRHYSLLKRWHRLVAAEKLLPNEGRKTDIRR